MKIKVMTKEMMYQEIAKRFVDTINTNPSCVLGFATGASVMGVYAELVNQYQNGKVSFKKVKTINVDEYVGLEPTHNQSYRYFMNDKLFNHIDIDINNTYLPLSTGNLEKNCQDYEEIIKSVGGIDLELLGIGTNGHLAFDEPGTPLDSLTHVARIDERTRMDNTRFFKQIEKVPTHALTMGLGSIAKARHIILLAFGANKAEAIKTLVEGPVSIDMPASVLKNHPDVTLYLDEDAASLLNK